VILLIDNYDSFTYNLYQLMSRLGAEIVVIRNDATSVEAVREMSPEGIVISPGPGTPSTAGISNDLVRQLGAKTPIFGVCLGQECIGEALGGRVIEAPELMHGKSSEVFHTGQGVFENIANPLNAIRYHSLALERASLPQCLEVTAQTATGTIMGVCHREWPVEGVQFHPESVMTPLGPALVENWLLRVKESNCS